MELGGKSAQILLDDADLARALALIAGGVFTHCGQACNAGTRLLVHRRIHDQVVQSLHETAKSMRLGPGIDDPDMGPLINQSHLRTVESYLDVAKQEGELLLGAEKPSDPALAKGAFARPALVLKASNKSRIAQEEIFGPVLTVISFSTPEEALQMANDSEFGLVAGVRTRDIGTALKLAQGLRVGQVWINSFGIGLDVEFPFGGEKRSGFGQEKGIEALATYQQIKNICVRHGF